MRPGRLEPEVIGGQLIEAERLARYALAAQLAGGRRVLDAGCGVGWGTGLLLDGGASSATGLYLDTDADADADARGRVPGARFVRGDLVQLPFGPGSYDLVVCFEALAHTVDQEKALDELVRVLAPEGLLLVSSSNPRAYPPDNPLQSHDLTPTQLRQAVGKRLPNLIQCDQHNHVASILVQNGSLAPGETRPSLARTVAPLTSGTNSHCMVIAGRGPLPSLPPLLCCAPSAPFGLDAPGSTQLERIASLEKQTEALRREREHTAVLLLESEQQLPRVLSIAEASLREQQEVGAALAEQTARLQQELAEQAAQLQQALAEVARLQQVVSMFRTSKSWRLTTPLRALSRLPKAKR